jgi:hypothetical protein
MGMTKSKTHQWGKWEYTENELDRQHREAVREGREAQAKEPHAKAVRYDRKSKRLVVDLINGAVFMVPIALLQGFDGASAQDIADVAVVPGGSALRWEKLDQDFGVPALIVGVFGTKTWMRELGRRSVKSKAASSRPNGAKGRGSSKNKIA